VTFTDMPPSPADPALAASFPALAAAEIEQIRASVHYWIDEIERQLPEAVSHAFLEREQKLSQELAWLQQEREELKVELERKAHEWESRLEALEGDRRKLADAWERLEVEQIAVVGSSRAAATVSVADSAPAPRAPNSRPQTETDAAVTRAILRQFEALRQDVRAEARAR
jgi:hypothetical protein